MIRCRLGSHLRAAIPHRCADITSRPMYTARVGVRGQHVVAGAITLQPYINCPRITATIITMPIASPAAIFTVTVCTTPAHLFTRFTSTSLAAMLLQQSVPLAALMRTQMAQLQLNLWSQTVMAHGGKLFGDRFFTIAVAGGSGGVAAGSMRGGCIDAVCNYMLIIDFMPLGFCAICG